MHESSIIASIIGSLIGAGVVFALTRALPKCFRWLASKLARAGSQSLTDGVLQQLDRRQHLRDEKQRLAAEEKKIDEDFARARRLINGTRSGGPTVKDTDTAENNDRGGVAHSSGQDSGGTI
jgi:hypothetical protein